MSSSAIVDSNVGDSNSADGPPDWSTLEFELTCPFCDYNLRELSANRCPECGRFFEWRREIDRARRALNPVFEEQARRQPIRSFFKTTVLLLVPWRFWRWLPPQSDVRLTALFLQFLLTLIVAGLVLLTGRIALDAIYSAYYYGGPHLYMDSLQFEILLALEQSMPSFILVATTWLSLQIFWQTRRRFRTRQVRLLRVTMYATFSLFLWGALGVILTKAIFYFGLFFNISILYRHLYLPTYIALFFFATSIRYGLRYHLGVERAWAMTVLALLLALVFIEFTIVSYGLYLDDFSYEGNILIRLFGWVSSPLWFLQF